MIRTAISVMTCPSRGQYLEQTIASIERAGGDAFDRVLYVDGPADAYEGRFPGWFVSCVSAEPGRGARHGMVEIMRRAAAADVELLLYFEDDVLLCRNAIRAMIEIGVPEPLGFVQYCEISDEPAGPPLELYARPGQPRALPGYGGFRGCQALAVPLRTLRTFETWEAPAWMTSHECDGVMAQIAPVYGVLDSLAFHTGVVSAALGRAHVRDFVARGWPGEDYDADDLPRVFTLNKVGRRCSLHGGELHPSGEPCSASSADRESF